MRPIPLTMRSWMSSQKFYDRCVFSGELNPEWHHVFKYAGKQINEPWAILPIAKFWHTGDIGAHNCLRTRELCEYFSISLGIMMDADFSKYNRFDWIGRHRYLNNKYKDSDEMKKFMNYCLITGIRKQQ